MNDMSEKAIRAGIRREALQEALDIIREERRDWDNFPVATGIVLGALEALSCAEVRLMTLLEE